MPRHEKIHGHEVKKEEFANNCFGCGPANEAGLRLEFVLDKERGRFVCQFQLADRFVGPPGHAHGGIIATILDEAMGKVNKLRNVIALTGRMEIDYLRPVPLSTSKAGSCGSTAGNTSTSPRFVTAMGKCWPAA
jgi:acyl-coenzyme A thioesterase PaaI-like protein